MRKKKPGLSNSEKDKISRDARRKAARKYGFRQSDYANWKVKDGYFFAVMDLGDVSLTVKPFYYDDLLWEILYKEEMKPVSLRATGGYVGKRELTQYPAPLDFKMDDSYYSEENAIKVWEEIFAKAEVDIARFFKEEPDVGKYEDTYRESGDQLPLLMNMCHHGRYEEAIKLIDDEWAIGRSGWLSFTMPDNSSKNVYDFIREYCYQRIQLLN